MFLFALKAVIFASYDLLAEIKSTIGGKLVVRTEDGEQEFETKPGELVAILKDKGDK